MENHKIIAEIHAYNEEKNVGRAIESVLNQTHKNIELHVLDNGSTDGTFNIIMEYAKKDNRVIPHRFYKNDMIKWLRAVHNMIYSRVYFEPTWYASLSADDEYEPRCFEKLLQFAIDNNLDAAAGRSQFVGDTQGRVYNKSVTLDDNMIIEGDDFGTLFSQYWRYYQVRWGHILRLTPELLRAFEGTETDGNIPATNGADGKAMLALLLKTKRIGVLNEFIHKYYIHEGSLSMVYTSNRYTAAHGISSGIFWFLDQKVGNISEDNYNFVLRTIYLRRVMNALPIICNANISDEEKIQQLHFMVKNEIAVQALNSNNIPIEEKQNSYKVLYDYLRESHNNDDFKKDIMNELEKIFGN